MSVSLVSDVTGAALASESLAGLTDKWQQFETTLSPSASSEDLKNSFVVQVDGGGETGEILFGLFSLMPPTYKDRCVNTLAHFGKDTTLTLCPSSLPAQTGCEST